MTKAIVRVTACVVISAGCAGEGVETSPSTSIDSAGVAIVWSDPRDALREPLLADTLVAIGLAEGDPRYTLGRIAGGSILAGNRIAVADGLAAQIQVYDEGGVHVDEWGGPGQGPGEFEVLWHLSPFPGDSIVAAETGARRVSVFGPEGEFGRLLRPEVNSVAPATWSPQSCCVYWGSTARGEHIVSTPVRVPTAGNGSRFGSHHVVVLDPEGAAPQGEANVRGGEYHPAPDRPGGVTAMHLGTAAALAPTADGFVSIDGRSYEVRFFGRDGELERIARLDRPRSPLPREVRGRVEAHYERLMERAGAGADASGLTWIADRPFPDSLPSYNVVVSDRHEYVWAGYVPGRFEGGEGILDLFTMAGTFVGSLTLPAGARPLDAKGDRLLISTTDELGVQRVRLVRVRGGPWGSA